MEPTTLVADRWFDGERVRAEPATFRVSGGRITAIEERATVPGADAVDARGSLLMPGMVNTHAHVARAGFFEAEEPPLLIAQIVANLTGALRAGVTTVADMGCTTPMLRAMRRLTERDPLAGPRVVGAGPILTAPDGYPLNWVSPLWRHAGAAIAVEGEEAARRAVDFTVREGMDHIKVAIMHESYAREPLAALSPRSARGIVAEARAQGRRVYAHAHTIRDYTVSLDAGVTALMHSSLEPLGPEMVARIRDAGVAVCPTLWAYEGTCLVGDCRVDQRPDLRRAATRPLQRSWRRFAEAYAASGEVFPEDSIIPRVKKADAREAMKVAAANLRLLLDAGVPIIFGNDASFGVSLLSRPTDELEAMQRAGMSALDCLRSATSVAADALGQPDLGRLRAGAAADFVIAPARVERDITALDGPLTVLVRGRRVPAQADAVRVARIARAYVEGTAVTVGRTLKAWAAS